jgi:hypothetical protein
MFENPDSNVGATIPVHRHWNPTLGDHYHTVQRNVGNGYIYEGIVGYVYGSSGPNRRAMYSFVKFGTNSLGGASINHYASVDPTPFPGYTSEGLAWYSPIVVNGCYDTRATNYNPYVNQASSGCIYPAPTASISVSSSSIIRGGTSTLTWSTTNATSISITNIGSGLATSGSRTISPTNTTTYTITASGLGGTVTRSVTLTVYVPPNIILSLDKTQIIKGECTFLRWTTTGDASSVSITPGIGSVNINGNTQICPTETIMYQAYTSGDGGSDYDSITVTVYQPPTVDLTGPESLNYGQQGILTYNATDADISLQIAPMYNYKNGFETGVVINLSTGKSVNGQIPTQIPYNDNGPFSVTYIIVATGNGGQETKQIEIPINVDETPDNFLIPESENLLKLQDPIVTPDQTLISYKIVIEDIDIPVEVKANKPILVDKNEQQEWKRIREL